LIASEHLAAQRRVLRQKTKSDHAVRLTAAHGLREQEDRRPRASAAQVPERPIDQREHAVGEVVLFKELCADHLPLEEGVKVQNRRASVGRMD
jgi:hypothetical protein